MRPGTRRRSIHTVLVLAFLGVAAVSIGFLSVQRYLWMTGELRDTDLASDAALARSVATGLERYMSQAIHGVGVLAADTGVTGLDRHDIVREDLDRFRRRHPTVSAIVVTDRAGVVRVASPVTDTAGKPNAGKRFDDRAWFQAAVAGATPSYDLVISRGASVGRPAMPIVAAIRSPRGEVIGVVAAAFNLDVLRRPFHVAGSADERVVVVDSRGQAIVHPTREWEAEAKDLSTDAVFRAAKRGTTGSVRYESPRGTAQWGSYVKLPTTGWVVWVPRVEDRWGPRMMGLLSDLAVSALLAILLAGVVAVLVSRTLSRPIRNLADATREVAAGRFDALAIARPASGIREFSDAFEGFSTMARALRAHYADLEAKVAERTHALEASAREAHAQAALLRAQDEIRRGYAELAGLLNSLDRSHILEEGTRKLAASIHAPFAAVYLTDNGPSTLKLKTYTSIDGSLIDAAALSPAGVPLEAARRGEVVTIAANDATQSLRLHTGAGALDIAAVVAVPLRHPSRLLGVLVVALFAAPNDEVRSFLDSAARQLSVALVNAGLFESVRHQSQQLEQLNVQLRRASEVKSQFLASMSHELRTPLNSIIGFTEILLQSRKDPLSERQRTALEKVHGSGRHLLGLINDVLDLSKIEAGRMDIRPEPFMIGPVAAECVAAVEPQAQAKQLAVSVVGADSAPPLVQDRAKLKQVIVNLLSNAVKFTDAGSVELRIGREQDTGITIAVTDTGRGIRPEDHALVFAAFRQAATTGAPAAGGTGLGLAITRRLVELLGGRITLTSAPGHGSVFTVIIPLRYERPRDDAPAFDAGGSGRRVLVIDDDRNVADIIRRATADLDVTIDWAADARDGLARAQRQPPAAIVLDVILQSELDGWEVLSALKQDPRTSGVPVLVYSAIDNPERARALAADAMLAKPAPATRIAETLAALAGRAAPAPTGVA